MQAPPQIYNLDAVAYESVMLGLFTMYRGERPDREKPNDLCVAFSRDGFHWSRNRASLHSGVRAAGRLELGNVQSAGGCCLMVGDRLHFYVSGRQGFRAAVSRASAVRAGHAPARRVRLAQRQWPPGAPRLAAQGARGSRRVRCGFPGDTCSSTPASRADPRRSARHRRPGDRTVLARAVRAGLGRRHAAGREMDGGPGAVGARRTGRAVAVHARAGAVVRFWVSPSASGESRGYLAAGGPGYTRPTDRRPDPRPVKTLLTGRDSCREGNS